MPSVQTLLLQHGYAFLFFYIFCVQTGIPIPADPLLLIMGALVGDRRYSFWLSLLAASTAALAGDALWYELGRHRGRPVLSLLCKFSIEPDTCVRKTEMRFRQRGAWTLLIAKFIPGMSLVSMPLAGAIGMERWRFLVADGAGCTLWSFAYLLAGKIFHREINVFIEMLGLLGKRAGLVVCALFAVYLAWKFFQRWRFRRELRINRVTPQETLAWIDAGHAITIVDLRHPAEVEESGFKIPGALVLRPEDLSTRSFEIPDANEVILYCSCPNEATSARVALQLKRAGVPKVHPLHGGIEAWCKLGLPVESVTPAAIATAAVPVAE